MQIFKDILQPGVTLTDDIFTTAYDTVAAELQGNIEHALRTQARAVINTSQALSAPTTQKKPLAPPPAQLERLPAYLIQAAPPGPPTLTRLLDGSLMANYNGAEHPFPPSQIANAVSWLDTRVRAAFNNTPDAQINRLLSSALPYLKEARTIASEANQRTRAAKLQDAILLIEQVIE